MIRLHPFTMIFFLTVLFIMVLIYNHPLYIILILGFCTVLFVASQKGEHLKNVFKYSLFNVVLIIIINALVNSSGKNVLLQSPRIPVVGKIKITSEALAYGMNMGLKLVCILLIFLIYDIMTDRDDTFSFFSKFAHKLTLTFSMANNIIHRLTIETMRVKEVMEMRGINFNEKKIKNRIKSYYPLLKVIFISALEGSIDRAEALHSRCYGKGKRTSYVDLKMTTIDYIFGAIALLLWLFFLIGLYYGVGDFQFYPRLQAVCLEDIIGVGILTSILTCVLIIVWGWQHWKFLKLKI